MSPKPSLCTQILDGEAGFWLNLLCFPFVLTYHAVRIYFFACFETLGRRTYRLWCAPCVSACFTWQFQDTEFEGQAAIGSDDAVDWVRATDIMTGKNKKGELIGPRLYEGAIEAADLCQGAVGDCWLVAALACAAEHPGSIRKAFVNREFNPRGRYVVRLFDPEKKMWVSVILDDRIPCRKGTKTPIYMSCNGNELWAVLLEKAFAKFCGSYKHLDGGWAMWGWRVLTGDTVFRLKLGNDDQWQRIDFTAKKGKDGIDGGFYTTKEKYKSADVWNLILNYLEDDCLVAASGGKDMGMPDAGGSVPNAGGLNGEQLNDAAGLVGTHAYSILDARELGLIPGLTIGAGLLGQTKLIKLRNPWGKYEWKGAWSDGTSLHFHCVPRSTLPAARSLTRRRLSKRRARVYRASRLLSEPAL